jgi:hypothetical protein
MELAIKVVGEDLPGEEFVDPRGEVPTRYRDVHVGLQRDEQVVEATPANRERVLFEPVFRVKEGVDGTTNFLGPFAKGTPRERFFYLVWIARNASGHHQMFRRLKVHLNHLPWEAVSRAVETGHPLTVRLPLTDKRGEPRCGSIRDGEARWEL